MVSDDKTGRRTSLLVHREGDPGPEGLCRYTVAFHDGGAEPSARFTVVFADQGSESANMFRAVDEASAVASRFLSHHVTPILVS